MRTRQSIVATSFCVFAAVLWIGVLWFASSLLAQERSIAARIAAKRQAAVELNSGSTALAIAASTEAGRTQLRKVFNRDLLSLAGLIGAAGQDAGVTLTVSNVTPGPSPSIRRGSPLHPAKLTFSTAAEGTFSQLMTALALLETLPAASQVTQVQLSRATGAESSSTPWTLNANIDIITGASVSS